ncbi:MAG: RodZ domain-containing protein [Oceanicaulis sp.]
MSSSNPDFSASDDAYVPVDAVFDEDGAGEAEELDLSLGERLKKARTRAGYTLDSASARTRIKRDYLEGLESMDRRALPSRAYAVGYLRTYASFLGLDAGACIDQFKAELDVDAGRATPTSPQERREIKLPRGVVGAVLILGGVIAAAAWYGNYVSRNEAFEAASSPMDTLLASRTPLVAVNERPAPRPDAIWTGLPDPVNARALVLEAAGPVYLEVRDASGRILVARDLEPGEVYRAPDEPGLTLSTSDAGSVLVRAGGRPLGALGESGEAVDGVSAAEFVIAALREARAESEAAEG